MDPTHILETERLRLRTWREDDRLPFAIMNADSRVMEHFPAPLSKKESNQLVDKIESHFDEHGYGLWAVEEKSSGEFIGFTGLNNVTFEAHFTPNTEIGWRLAYDAWGKGYATEAAQHVLHHAFNTLQLDEIVSFTTETNQRSQRVMQKIGLEHNPADDFNHPKLAPKHPLCHHVLYRKSR